MEPLSLGHYSLVSNAFSFVMAAMAATTVFLFLSRSQIARYQSVHGAGFSIAPIFRQSAWFRFHNRAEGIRNLFLVGAGTHPGAGLPGVISSAKAVDQMFVSRPKRTCSVGVALLSLVRHLSPRWRDCLELGVILIGGLALQPLVYFLCYFGLLHSPRHLTETAPDVGLRGVRAIVLAVAPPVVATLLLAALLWRYLPATTLSARLLGIAFIGLAALTVPHLLLTSMSGRVQRKVMQTAEVGCQLRRCERAFAAPAPSLLFRV